MMFTPIRNFITYIQKNASGSTFFGGTTSNTELNDTCSTTMDKQSEEIESRTVIMAALEPTTSLKDQNRNEINSQSHNQTHHNTSENQLSLEGVDKPSMSTSMPFADPMGEQNMYNNVDYEGENDGEEDEKDIFLDFPTEDGDIEFPTSEVIVLNDPDLNLSMNSDPAADPLALDDYNVNLGGVNSPSALDSSTESNVLFVVDIEEVVGKAPRLIDEVDESRQLKASVQSSSTADEQELRSDGSDSGLGSETSTLQTNVTTDTSVGSIICTSPIIEKLPKRSNLKRHLRDVHVDDGVVGGGTGTGHQLQKKPRRSINFDGVKVFYFPRIQGHGCVPSQGGCTLGMGAHHVSFKTFSLAEHAAELRRAHKLQLQEINPRGSSSEESDSDEELSEGSGSDLDAETNGFLQPVSPKQRRALLKAAGIRKIDANEKIECRDIRNSREVCGCVCRDFCDPDTCACSQAGIKCQVDRAMFPCGCSRDACGNVIGRIEFNPARVRTHFIHTIMRLDMENRQQKRSDEVTIQQLVAASSSSVSSPASHLVYNNVSALVDNGTPPLSSTAYNAMPGYNGLDQSPNLAYNHHHQMHQQYNVYNNHHPMSVNDGGLCAQIPANMMVSQSILPPTHNSYSNANVNAATAVVVTPTEADSTALNGSTLHYPDGPIYPPPDVNYGDMLAPYANTTSFETPNSTYSTANVYGTYHTSPHLDSNMQPFLGYGPACNGDMPDFNEVHNGFISLNTPDASSARMTAINDLLHNNRNTTTALIAVSPMNNSFACEVAPQSQQLNVLPAISSVSDIVADSGIRPETPPDEETPHENQIIQILELPKTTPEVLLKAVSTESIQTDESKDSPEVALREPPHHVELSKSDVPLVCESPKTEEGSSFLNGSNDQQVEQATKPDENGTNNTTTDPPTAETVVVSA